MRNVPVRGKQRQPSLLLVALIEGLDRLQPCFTLTVVDLPQIQDVPIHHAAARHAAFLRDAPVPVFLAVLESSVTLQIHGTSA
jgi:hypothetical protein